MTAPLKQDANGHPLDGVDWIAVWETRAASELFAAVRAYCGLPPVAGPVPTDDEVQRELAEARAILAAGSASTGRSSCASTGASSSDSTVVSSSASTGVAGADFGQRRFALAKCAATSTLEALMYALRARGVAALNEADTRRRLGELNDDQVIEVGTRLRNLKPEIARPWTADEVEILMQAYERLQ